MAQNDWNGGHPQPLRHTPHIDLPRNSTAETHFDREQASTHHAQSSSSRDDAPTNETMQRARQREDTDPSSSLGHGARISGAAQYKRKRTDPNRDSTSRLGGRIDEQFQRSGQGSTRDQASSLKEETRTHEAAPSGQQTQSNNRPTSSRHDGRGQREIHQDLPSTSKQRTVADQAGEDPQVQIHKVSRNEPRQEDTEVLTAGMNTLPPPCWEDDRVIYPLVREQLVHEEYHRRRERRLNDIWGLYGKEREVLAASHTISPEETWTPELDQEVILERETPLWDEIWERSVLQGEAEMRDILDQDDSWPQEARREPEVWSREPDGMLNSTALKQLLRVFTLKESLREG